MRKFAAAVACSAVLFWSPCRSFGTFNNALKPKLTRPRTAAANEVGTLDPFRPLRHPLEPVAINVLQRALFRAMETGGDDDRHCLERTLDAIRESRSAPEGETLSGDDERLTFEEWSTVEAWARGVVASKDVLEAALVEVAAAHPWIAKYKVKSST